MDNCKEMSIIFAGLEFARRGINALSIDGPGQGEDLPRRNIHARPDYEVAGTAAFEYVAKRPDVDPKRIVIMGYSFGGYHAARIAGMEKRYAGGVAFGAMKWKISTTVSRKDCENGRRRRRAPVRLRSFSFAGWLERLRHRCCAGDC